MNGRMSLRQDAVGLYLHIPFCARRCRFCAFFTRGHQDDRVVTFVADLVAEIRLAAGADLLHGRPVETVYFGGGTPTTLSAEQLLMIVKTCRQNFAMAPTVEITVEANPAGIEEADLRALRVGGINRISFGAQSFDEADLERAGTPHRVADIARAFSAARQAGFYNLNLDLMYGFPDHSPTRWLATLTAAIALEPDHLSFYGLTLEEGTSFYREAQQGRLTVPGEDTMADLYRIGLESLTAAGFLQYEVSNFARPGHACRHNLGYWTDREWLGLGPSAHSYLNGDRFSHVESLKEYHRLVTSGMAPVAEWERGTPDLRLREAMAFGLRTVEGVRVSPLKRRYRLDPIERFRRPIEKLTREGWLAWEGERLRPSPAGMLMADELAVAFL
jgi:oxygen-independent coproporphyrinogen III oxidase